MQKNKVFFLFLLLIVNFNLFSQKEIYVGMTSTEFKTKLPGVLPDELKFNEDLTLKESLHGIEGNWTFNFNNSILNSSNFIGKNSISNETDFYNWINSAKSIIDDFSNVYGKPIDNKQGHNKFIDRNSNEFKNRIGKREIFHEATWETKSVIIKITCDYRSNYFEEFRENMPNGPVEWYYYNFQIQYSYIPGIKEPQPDKIGKFYLGMKVSDFALVFPKLFPNGIALSGQWERKEKLYELDGSWNYDFLNGKLDWYSYDKYLNEINESNFTKSLNAAKSLINDYTKIYGKPDTTIIGNTNFVNPREKHHWGYDVIEAKWYNANGMKIKIEFTFMGGKGEYHFLVKIEHFGKDYQYFD